MTNTVFPFGPQHPVLPEPLQLKLIMKDERIIEAVPAIGYVHRGLEKLVEKKDFVSNVQIVERVCGICSNMHALAYCMAIEEIMEIQVPDRAGYLRVIWAELHRIHSHLLWLGLFADSFGYENLFMQCWKCRERILEIMENTAGHRIFISTNTIGGTHKDLSDEQTEMILSELKLLRHEMLSIKKDYLDNYTIKYRLVGVGILTKEQAYELGACGHVAKASGIDFDMRTQGYAAYHDLEFQPITHTDGDSYARMVVRIEEVFQSIELVREAIGKLPGGELAVKVKGFPLGEAAVRVEQPRGEVLYYVKGNGTKYLDRLRIRTPTFANLPALLKMLPGCRLPDVPVLILTIDPCISCTER